MISTITFEHGVKTCAVELGKFCRWFGCTHFGTRSFGRCNSEGTP